MTVQLTPVNTVYTVTVSDPGEKYPIVFPFLDSSDMQVYYVPPNGRLIDRIYLVQRTEYAVVDTNIVISITIPVDSVLVIERLTPPTQDILWIDGQAVYAPDIMHADDKLTYIIQELQDRLNRAVIVPPESDITTDDMVTNLLDSAATAVQARDAAQAEADRAQVEADRAQAEADRAQAEAVRARVEADRAQVIADGTLHKSRFFNTRSSFPVEIAQAANSILTLPETYFPTRNHMLLFYNGVLCELASAASDALYQYSEIGTVDNLSNQVTLHFPIRVGDRFDMFATASGILQNLDTLEQTLTEALVLISTLQESQLTGAIHMFSGKFQYVNNLWYPIQPETGAVMTMYGLCNGSIYPTLRGGTILSPNMHDRFVLGTKDQTEIGQYAGSVTHTHTGTTNSVAPSVYVANHILTINQIPWHQHYVALAQSIYPGDSTIPSGTNATTATTGQNTSAAGASEGHNHSASQAFHSHSIAAAEGGTYPPYYKLAYIISL